MDVEGEDPRGQTLVELDQLYGDDRLKLEELEIILTHLLTEVGKVHDQKPTAVHGNIRKGTIRYNRKTELCTIDPPIDLKDGLNLYSHYASRELILTKKNPSISAIRRNDIFAIGCVMYMLVNAEPPYEMNNEEYDYQDYQPANLLDDTLVSMKTGRTNKHLEKLIDKMIINPTTIKSLLD